MYTPSGIFEQFSEKATVFFAPSPLWRLLESVYPPEAVAT